LLKFRRCSVYERSAVFRRIPNILQTTVRYSASHISAGHAYTGVLAAALLVARFVNQKRKLETSTAYHTCIILTVTQVHINLREIYTNLENHREFISAQSLYCQNLEKLGYIFAADSIQIFVVGSERRTCFETSVSNGPSRSSKVVDFGTNRKRVCDFLLVINSNLGPILPR